MHGRGRTSVSPQQGTSHRFTCIFLLLSVQLIHVINIITHINDVPKLEESIVLPLLKINIVPIGSFGIITLVIVR